jgi:hypothetical protein
MQRTKLLKIPFAELLVAGLVILLPLANSPDLMQGIQTARLFGFFYGLLALAAVCAIGFLFRNQKAQLEITVIDLLLVVFLGWVSVNKYVFNDIDSYSLRYFDLVILSAPLLTIGVSIKTNNLRQICSTWEDDFDLDSFRQYPECIEENEKVLVNFKQNGESIIRYRKSLLIAGTYRGHKMVL